MEQDDESSGPIGYMCKTDFEYELGCAAGGNRIFPSITDLKKHKSCWETCGIVKVSVRYIATEVEENFSGADDIG